MEQSFESNMLGRLQGYNNARDSGSVLRYDGQGFFVNGCQRRLRAFLQWVVYAISYVSCNQCQCLYLVRKIADIYQQTSQQQNDAISQIYRSGLNLNQCRITVKAAIDYLHYSLSQNEYDFHEGSVTLKADARKMPMGSDETVFYHVKRDAKHIRFDDVTEIKPCPQDEFLNISVRDYKVDFCEGAIKEKLLRNTESARRHQFNQEDKEAFWRALSVSLAAYGENDFHERPSPEVRSRTMQRTANKQLYYYTDSRTLSGVACCQGDRKVMEDTTVPYRPFQGNQQSAMQDIQQQEDTMVGIMDGHSSKKSAHDKLQVSEFVARILPHTVSAAFNEWNRRLPGEGYAFARLWNAIKHAFVKVDRMKIQAEGGTTAIIGFIKENSLVIANAGDCRAILVTPDNQIIQLSEDAQCDFDQDGSPDKFTRSTLKRGGFVLHGGFYANRVNADIESARNIGDHKTNDSYTYACNPRPKITRFSAPDIKDCLLILCSDGLTKRASTNQIGQCVLDLRSANVSLEQISAILTESAYLAGRDSDNITVSITPVSSLFPG